MSDDNLNKLKKKHTDLGRFSGIPKYVLLKLVAHSHTKKLAVLLKIRVLFTDSLFLKFARLHKKFHLPTIIIQQFKRVQLMRVLDNLNSCSHSGEFKCLYLDASCFGMKGFQNLQQRKSLNSGQSTVPFPILITFYLQTRCIEVKTSLKLL